VSRVLCLTYYFPPTGGAGTQRSTTFVRELNVHGHDTVVITGPGPSDSVWSPEDESLSSQLPPGVEIRRVPGPVPASTGRAEAVRRRLDLPSSFARWWVEGAIRTAAGMRDLGEVDLIYASMSPYESGRVAAILAQRLGVPWIADLRDPWALDEMREYPSAAHRLRDLRRMGTVLGSASAVVMNTPEARRRLLARFPELGARTVVQIPNGFDASDFASPAAEPDSDRFRIVHAGSLHTAAGREGRGRALVRRALGGSAPIDVLTRSHVYLLRAMAQLREAEPDLGRELELHLAGNLTAADRRAAGPDSVLHGYLPHRRSVELLRSADLLFLPMQNLPAGHRATIVPGKTYEYLGSGRPVLAAVPDGDAHDLITASANAWACRPDDVAGMAEILRRELLHKRAHGRRPDTPRPELARHERRRLGAELAALVDELCPGPIERRPPDLRLVG
jgi:glycosyltransferase involved in cell wall biosynthesis